MKVFQRNGSSILMFLFHFFSSVVLVPQWGENELNINTFPKI